MRGERSEAKEVCGCRGFERFGRERIVAHVELVPRANSSRIRFDSEWSIDAPIEHESRFVAEFHEHGSGKHKFRSASQYDSGNPGEVARIESAESEEDFNVWTGRSNCDLEHGLDSNQNECVIPC